MDRCITVCYSCILASVCVFSLLFCFSSARLSCDYRCKNVIIFVNSRSIYLCNVYRTYINKNAIHIHTHTFEKLTSMGDHKVYIKWKMSSYYQNDGSSNSSKTPEKWSDCLSNFLMVNALVLSSRLADSLTHTIICNYFGHHRKAKWSFWDVISIINRIFAYFCAFELDLNPLQFLVEFYFKCLLFILAVAKSKNWRIVWKVAFNFLYYSNLCLHVKINFIFKAIFTRNSLKRSYENVFFIEQQQTEPLNTYIVLNTIYVYTSASNNISTSTNTHTHYMHARKKKVEFHEKVQRVQWFVFFLSCTAVAVAAVDVVVVVFVV